MYAAIVCAVLVLVQTAAAATQMSTHTNVYPHDFLCNNGTEHACICYERDGSLQADYMKCDRFLEVRTLPVVAIAIKQLDVTAILYSGEPYESYFKRRVARIVSRYCEHKANRCPGTSLRLSQDNVVILAIECATKNETIVRFVVTKALHVGSLTPLMIIKPSKVKEILSAQLGALERVLGGVKIEGLTEDSITREALIDGEPGYTKKDNTLLLVMLLLIAIFFVVVYVVAIFKVCKDHHDRKRARRKAASLAAGKKPSYGAISPHDSANQAGASSATSPVPRPADLNGRTTVVRASVNTSGRRNSSICSDEVDPSVRRDSIPVRTAPPPPPGAPTLHRRSSNQPSPPQLSSNHFTVLAETPIASTRGLFVCDESQLPAELPLPPVDVLAEGAPAHRPSLVYDDDVKRSATMQELPHTSMQPFDRDEHDDDNASSASDFESDADRLDAYHKLSPTASAIFTDLNGYEPPERAAEPEASSEEPWLEHVITVQQTNEETQQWWNEEPETSSPPNHKDIGRDSPLNGELIADQEEPELQSNRGALQPNAVFGVQPASSEDNLIPLTLGDVNDNEQPCFTSSRTKHDTDSESGQGGASSHSSSDADTDSDSEHDPRIAAGLLATGDYHRLAESNVSLPRSTILDDYEEEQADTTVVKM